jgi:hypothetical protein
MFAPVAGCESYLHCGPLSVRYPTFAQIFPGKAGIGGPAAETPAAAIRRPIGQIRHRLGVHRARPFAFLTLRRTRNSSNAPCVDVRHGTERFPARDVRPLPVEGVAL